MARKLTAKRTISFYECVNGLGDRLEPIDWEAVIKVIDDLDPDTDARFIARDGEGFHGRVARHRNHPDLLVVAHTRTSGWPDQERRGKYSELVLSEGTNLAEATHVAFFDQNVVGIMRGGEGPTVGRIERYVTDKVDFGDDSILFKPILHPDVRERMQDVEYLRRFTLRIPASEGNRLPAEAETMRGIVNRARNRYGNVEIELTIKVPTRGADEESARVLNEVRAVIDAGTADALEKASMTYVNHRTGHGDELDFLNDRLTMKVNVALKSERSKNVQDDAAASALQQAYDALAQLIDRSLG